MAATRLVRTWKSSSGVAPPSSASSQTTLTSMRVTCTSKAAGFVSDHLAGDGERKPVVAVMASTATTVTVAAPQTSQGPDLATLLSIIGRRLKMVTTPRPWTSIVQSFIEKVIIDCRFFAVFAVAGTLLGSVLCFSEGTFLVVESYIEYFRAISQHSDHGHMMQLLIEALDMFLVGTTMLIFGMGLKGMFIGSGSLNEKGSQLPSSNFFGLFYLKEIPSWAGMKSITEAKSKIGHALMLLLQVGVLEKFKSIPLVTGLDLACFAGAIFVSSAGLFLLSRLSPGIQTKNTQKSKGEDIG